MIYSYLVGHFFPLFAVTAFAAVTSIVFSALYIWWSTEPRTTRRFYRLWGGAIAFLAIITVYVAIAIAGVTHQSRQQVVSILGYCCVVVNLSLKDAPLKTIKRIVRTKNASSMPVTMSVVAFVNGVLWVWTCILVNDMYVLTPNAAGAALGGIQAIVYVIYWPGATERKLRSESDLKSTQSGHEACACSEGKEQSKSATFVEIRFPR